tara:strand:+ start:851 stop:1123 length:273 start_codon:yes stop_codon:yes gene_type:complete
VVALKISLAKSVNSLLLDPSNGTEPDGLEVVVVVVVVLDTCLGCEPSAHVAGDGLVFLVDVPEVLELSVAGVIVYSADGALVVVLNKFEK